MLKIKISPRTRISIVGVMAILLTLMVVIVDLRRGIPMIWDTWFHIGRVIDIREAFKAHQVPTWINFSSYYGMGQAINGMYPDITLWPLIFITNSFSLVNQVIAIKVLILGDTFLISYISLVNHKFKKESSFYVAILYTFSGYSLYQFLYELQPGAIIIYIFTFPLIFSIEEVLYAKSIEKKLIIKLSLLFGVVLYSHLLSAAVIACLILILWFIRTIVEQELNYFSILNLIFASLLSFLYSMPILYRVYVISKSKIAPPYGKGVVDSENLIDIFTNPQIYARVSLSFVALILFIISIHYFGKEKEVTKLLIAEMVIIILCSNLIPWNILGKLPLINMFQFTPWRFGIYLSALPMLAFLHTSLKNKNMILCVLAILSLVAVPEAFKQNNSIFKSSQCSFIKNNTVKENDLNIIIRDYLPAKVIGNSTENAVPSFYKKQALYPAMNGVKNIKLQRVNQRYGSISFHNQDYVRNGTYVIPVYYYSSLNYQIKVNNKDMPKIKKSSNGLMMIKITQNLHKNSKITVKYRNPKFYNVLLIISLSMYVFVCAYFIRQNNLTELNIC
ncbi:MAG: hypothetical protein HDT49_03775 [Lactobacillus sp.]|nr:hypothetical protein [Lactobacillus sp.]